MADTSMPEKLGRYQIVAELGKGAMGVVYEGRDPNIGRRVAIKTARRDVLEASGMAAELMQRFLREAHAAGTLSHPNIITIYDAGEENGIAYIAMEFIEGGDLGDLLDSKRRSQFTEEQIVEIGASICDALALAHDNGIVHRDIKPANVMMPKDGPIKVADFGIAHMSDSNLTQEGALIGTPHYMSPEQFMGQKVDGRADLFSVGVMLYELLTGEKPFTGEALSTVMHHVIKTMPAPPHELNFRVPEASSWVVMKALSKRPAERYADGRAMAAALRESIKPNPDPAILGVVRPGSAPADATVVTRPQEGATVLSQSTPPGVMAPAALSGSTLDRAVPRSAGDTTISEPVAPVPVSPAKSKTPMMAGAAAVLVVLLATVGVLLRGGEPPADSGAASGETASSNTEPYFGKAALSIFQTTDKALYLDIESGEYSTEDGVIDINRLRGQVLPAAAKVVVKDQDGNVVADVDNYKGGQIELSGKPTRLKFDVVFNGVSSPFNPTKSPEGPSEQYHGNLVLLNESGT